MLNPYLSDLNTEEFWVIGKSKLSGGINQSVVDVRILFKSPLDHLSTGIVVAHNHPSGNLKPSADNLKITKQISEACNLEYSTY